jgi:type II restriction enzyme
VPTKRQVLGRFGELCVVKECGCPKCKRSRTLKRLPNNFKCADVICDFCGYLGQVKAITVNNVEEIPATVLGAAWVPQKERMEAAIYFPLFLVLVSGRQHSIFYLSADLQTVEMFKPRTPLSDQARRAGWQGFIYDLSSVRNNFVRSDQFLLEDRCASADQMSFFSTFRWRSFVFAMRDRNRPNKDGIAILALSVTTKDFPHDMLLSKLAL